MIYIGVNRKFKATRHALISDYCANKTFSHFSTSVYCIFISITVTMKTLITYRRKTIFTCKIKFICFCGNWFWNLEVEVGVEEKFHNLSTHLSKCYFILNLSNMLLWKTQNFTKIVLRINVIAGKVKQIAVRTENDYCCTLKVF